MSVHLITGSLLPKKDGRHKGQEREMKVSLQTRLDQEYGARLKLGSPLLFS